MRRFGNQGSNLHVALASLRCDRREICEVLRRRTLGGFSLRFWLRHRFCRFCDRRLRFVLLHRLRISERRRLRLYNQRGRWVEFRLDLGLRLDHRSGRRRRCRRRDLLRNHRGPRRSVRLGGHNAATEVNHRDEQANAERSRDPCHWNGFLWFRCGLLRRGCLCFKVLRLRSRRSRLPALPGRPTGRENREHCRD